MAWTEYRARYQTQEIERARPTELRLELYDGASLSAPSSGTVSVYNASNTAVVDAQAVTITASVATYEVQTASVSAESFGAGWRVEWSLVMGDTYTHVFREEASLVRVKLHPAASNADLLRRHPDLASYYPTGESSWDDQIAESWRWLTDKLEGLGRRPALIISPAALRPVHQAAALELICRLLAGSGSLDNSWTVLAEHYLAERDRAFGDLRFDYDEDDDGQGTATRRRAGRPQIFLAGRG